MIPLLFTVVSLQGSVCDNARSLQPYASNEAIVSTMAESFRWSLMEYDLPIRMVVVAGDAYEVYIWDCLTGIRA